MKASIIWTIIGLACILGFVGCNLTCGIGGWGPTRAYTDTVQSKHVDAGKETGSSYMVTTDAGTFEVDNGILLGVWNADEIYGRIHAGKRYTFVTKGNRWTNLFMQEYPYVVRVEPIE